MNFNPAVFPTFLLAFGFFMAGERAYTRRPRTTFTLGLVLALPCALAILFYTHLFDGAVWYYDLRALPFTELAFSAIGLLAGAVYRWNAAEILSGQITAPTLFAVALLIPFIKPILQPIDTAALTDKCNGNVCLQSSPSTCGPASAATILRTFGEPVTEKALAVESHTYAGGTEAWYLARALRRRGATAEFLIDDRALPSPAIAGVRLPGGAGHFIAILRASGQSVSAVDPVSGEFTLPLNLFRTRYHLTGFFLTIQPKAR